MRLVLVLIFIVLIGCNDVDIKREQKLRDTIELLRRKADFKPLEKLEAYRFINDYYLPRLDTLPIKRRINIFPLKGIDFSLRFKNVKGELEAEFAHDSVAIKTHRYYLYPFDYLPDKSYRWNKQLLKNVVLVDSSSQLCNVGTAKDWRKLGYMCLSYPQYNANTKRLIIREWLENGMKCGTGREQTFSYTRTVNGWKQIEH